jgi:hypothetical protein
VYKNEIIPHKEKRKQKSMKTNSKKSNVEGHKKDQSHLMSIFKTYNLSHEAKINVIEGEKKKKQNPP